MATENAVAALGKVLEFHGAVIEGSAAAQSWDLWINSLPLVEDKVEAKHVHAQLVRHIQASDARCALLPLPPPAGRASKHMSLSSGDPAVSLGSSAMMTLSDMACLFHTRRAADGVCRSLPMCRCWSTLQGRCGH